MAVPSRRTPGTARVGEANRRRRKHAVFHDSPSFITRENELTPAGSDRRGSCGCVPQGTPRSDDRRGATCSLDSAPQRRLARRMDGHEVGSGPSSRHRRWRDWSGGQSMRAVGHSEKEKVAQQWPLRRRQRGGMTGAGVADDHRRLQLGERVSCLRTVSGADDRQGGAKRQTACQGKAHQRQKQQAQNWTLGRVRGPHHATMRYYAAARVQVPNQDRGAGRRGPMAIALHDHAHRRPDHGYDGVLRL